VSSLEAIEQALDAVAAADTPLAEIAAMHRLCTLTERSRDELIYTALANGATSGDIGRAVGMLRQSAHKRWVKPRKQ